MNLYTRTLASIAVAWSIAASGQSVKDLSGTIGFQFGGQVYRQIIFFQDQSAYDDCAETFTDANFEFDAQASAVAVTASAQASSGTQGSQTSVAAASSGELSGAETYYNGMRG